MLPHHSCGSLDWSSPWASAPVKDGVLTYPSLWQAPTPDQGAAATALGDAPQHLPVAAQ